MSSFLDYADPANQLETRTELSPVLRGGLIDVPRDTWANDPRFRGEPEFWLRIHHNLVEAARELPRRCERLLLAGDRNDANLHPLLTDARILAQELTQHAHGHHHIEDQHFFPVFARAVPGLVAHLELLDGDHRVLADILERMESATAAMPARLAGPLHEQRDALLGPTESLFSAATRFDELFRRHIGDEEEICIPVMLSR